MKNSILTLFTCLAFGMTGFGQSMQSNLGNKIPQESVYLQFNQSLLFSGEHLLYKVYCLDKSRRQLTHISKMAYVSLVDKNGNSVFTHKVRLEKGAGYGDFFVPTSITTGSYKLIGYSEWMKNFGKETFFQSDVKIINPYQPLPAEYLEQVVDSTMETTNLNISQGVHQNIPKETNGNGVLKVDLEKNELDKREKLTITFSTENENFANGNYGLSVRKLDQMDAPSQISAQAFFKDYVNRESTAQAPSTVQNLPEIRGEVISGTIVNKEGGTPVGEVKISLSLPGEDYLFNVATSDAQGRFRFVVDQEYDNVTAALQVLAEDSGSYEIRMDENKAAYPGVQVVEFKLSKEMGALILEKSIQNQIENGFRAVKSDSIIPAQHAKPFYRNYTEHYDLDDYTRFNSIQETIVEVVDQVSVRRLDNGDRWFEIRPEEGFTDLNLRPMVFVDGLFVKRHEEFMDFGAKKIKSISFARNKVILGQQVFQGVLSFKTIEGDFYSSFYTPNIVNVDLFKPQPKKQYFNQTYTGDNTNDRVPDFRYQLLWVPKLDLADGSEELELFTSDVSGTYLLTLEGFSATGNPVSISRQFMVK
ncbi:hypothetical protein [Flagellimonas flava]|uniref:MG2 domain-containing protein n=1 Tax=Flagellimonas flava TaxID=570519 RepID=A0A1M5IFJ6_9FLAO|nr:hypothetical protein [Allomuricauda flava]SHG27016.1 hypothetical protein SAMN04488116_0670 [Allomuricauda flava]